MQTIYEPKGRALEYSLLALNLYRGCSHHCAYCYVPSMLQVNRPSWQSWTVAPRKNILRHLRRDAERFQGTDKRVLLCFTSDPYSPEAAASGVTREALKILREFQIPFQALTKGGMRAAGDFDQYGRHDAFATTMTFLDPNASEMEEPGAALPADRMRAILEAHRQGIETWVSLEPVLDPAASLRIIEQTHDFVDLFKIGKLNHDACREREIDWRDFGMQAIALCQRYRKPYYVKDDLVKHLDGVTFTNTDTRTVTPVAGPLFAGDAI